MPTSRMLAARSLLLWTGSFVLLVAFQVLGWVIATAGRLPVPGPVLGLVLLAAALGVPGRRRHWRRARAAPAADSLLTVLPLLFVPAGVGVVQYLGSIGRNLAGVGTALLLSSVVTLLATGAVLEGMLRRHPAAASPMEPTPAQGS